MKTFEDLKIIGGIENGVELLVKDISKERKKFLEDWLNTNTNGEWIASTVFTADTSDKINPRLFYTIALVFELDSDAVRFKLL
jgi:hypothetical protein